jgi:hypothetical protein
MNTYAYRYLLNIYPHFFCCYFCIIIIIILVVVYVTY